MKKYLLTLFTALSCLVASAQGAKGIKIAYIDMNYILDKAPDYADAKNQLEQKAQKWKQEIDVKRNEISKLSESLKAEKALLTKELIEEREEEIAFLEKDLLDYQEKRFGPTGDLVTQKAVLVKPIQDQIFTIVQDLSELRKYDFVFDRSSDLTMLFAANKHDISDLVLKRMARASKQETMSNRQLKKLEEQEAQEEKESNPEYQDKQKVLEDKKAERQRKLDEKKAAQQANRDAIKAKQQQAREEREAKKNGTAPKSGTNAKTNAAPASGTDAGTGNTNMPATTVPPTAGTDTGDEIQGDNAVQGKTTANDAPEEGSKAVTDKQNAAAAAKAAREQQNAERRKAIEDKKKQIIADREAARKAKLEKNKKPADTNEPTDTTTPTDGTTTPSTNPASPDSTNDPE